MKKIITLILTLILAFSVGFTACKGDKNVSSSSSSIIQSEEGSSTSSTVSKEESVSFAESESATSNSVSSLDSSSSAQSEKESSTSSSSSSDSMASTSSSTSSSTSGESQEPTNYEYTRVDEEGNESKTGSYVLFGSYPQSDVTASMSTVLADKVATLPTSNNANGWISYKYYVDSSNKTDFMWYKDVDYGNEKYRAVYFTSYRLYATDYSCSIEYASENTFQDDNGYYISYVYWFKFEPIKWKILYEGNRKATLLAEMILDSQDYNYTGSNNYEYSSIRSWLNDTFYNTAFNESQQYIIQAVKVDNGEKSTMPHTSTWSNGANKYACVDTNDVVWLLSEQEVTKASYGFLADEMEYDAVRQKKSTAYGKCQGIYTNTSSGYVGNSDWWLRSPSMDYGDCSLYVTYKGDANNKYTYTNGISTGIVPAIRILLGGSDEESVYIRVDSDGNESEIGSYALLGSYPQSNVTASMSTVLADKVATLPTSENSNGWTSYRYYISSSNETDFMWYKDVEYKGSKYRAVYFTSYRPRYTNYSSSTSNTYQDDNGYKIKNVYWFKYEPIKWRILKESNVKATLLAEMILDSQEYYDNYNTRTINEETIYANNYEYSNIRKWLNDNFYNTAFNELEKALIQTVEVDNSARSTNPYNNATYFSSGVNNYACNNTNDKVWLLSEQEVTRESYGFSTSTGETTTRQKKTTAYSQCQGCYTSTSSSYAGNGNWWLRSPYYNSAHNATRVDSDGISDNGGYVSYTTSHGVVPALQISL